MSEVSLIPGTIPLGFCPASEQERLNMYAALLTADVSSDVAVISTTTPSVDDQDKFWVRKNADGSYEGIYTFSAGAWVRPYEVPASSSVRWLWVGAEVDLETFDGGSAGAVTATTGPFWEADHDFDDVIPRGATATVPVGTNASQLSSGASATDQVRGVFFAKRTARTYRTA